MSLALIVFRSLEQSRQQETAMLQNIIAILRVNGSKFHPSCARACAMNYFADVSLEYRDVFFDSQIAKWIEQLLRHFRY